MRVRGLPRAVRMFWVGSLAAFLLTLVVAWLEYRAGFSWQRVNPWADPAFADLLEYVPTLRLLHTEGFYHPAVSPVAYPPFAVVLLGLVYGSGHPVGAYLTLAAVVLTAVGVGVARALVRAGWSRGWAACFVATGMLVSFPIERLIHQGNVELFLWVFAAGGIVLFVRGRDDGAAMLWGLAAAVKLYPLVLLGLLLPRGRWRAVGVGLATFVGASVASMWWMGPTVGAAWRGSLRNVFGYQGLRASEWTLHELAANHSAFMLVKFAAILGGRSAAEWTKWYYVAGLLAFAVAFFGRLWRMPIANQVLGVSLFMVMLPPISYYHTLVHLYAPLILLILVATRAREEVRGLRLTMALFVVLFTSFTLFTFPSVFLFAGLVQAAALCVLFGCSIRYPFAMGAERPVERLHDQS